jgi:hypothetical protein
MAHCQIRTVLRYACRCRMVSVVPWFVWAMAVANFPSPEAEVTIRTNQFYEDGYNKSTGNSPGTLDTKHLPPRRLSRHYQVSYRILLVCRPLFVPSCSRHLCHHILSKSNATLFPVVRELHPAPWPKQIYDTLDTPPSFQSEGRMSLSQGRLMAEELAS